VSLAGVVSSLSGGVVVTVARRATGSLAQGRYTPASPTTFTIPDAVVSPATGRDLLRLPEGVRTREVLAILSTVELRTANEHAATPADVVTYKGRAYEVQTVEDWTDNGGFWRALAAKVEA
jgi:hypothetical protein